MDGYGKLKPYASCIDGFSRKMLWLKVYSSNKDPKVVCRYFCDLLLI